MKYLKKLLKVYTYQQIADMMGYSSRSTIASWVKNNKVPFRKISILQMLAKDI